jgi:acyl-CoA reductase-like NAD-dependent aldehyde dehydrogenase
MATKTVKIVENQVVVKEIGRKGVRSRVIDARFRKRIAEMKEEHRRIIEEHTAERMKRHDDAIAEIESAQARINELKFIEEAKRNEIVRLNSMIADFRHIVCKMKEVEDRVDDVVESIGGLEVLKRHPGLFQEIFHAAEKHVASSNKNQPNDRPQEDQSKVDPWAVPAIEDGKDG